MIAHQRRAYIAPSPSRLHAGAVQHAAAAMQQGEVRSCMGCMHGRSHVHGKGKVPNMPIVAMHGVLTLAAVAGSGHGAPDERRVARDSALQDNAPAGRASSPGGDHSAQPDG